MCASEKGALEVVFREVFSETQAKTDGSQIVGFSDIYRLREGLKSYVEAYYSGEKIEFGEKGTKGGHVWFPAVLLLPPIVGNPFEASLFIYADENNQRAIPPWGIEFMMPACATFITFFDPFQRGSALQLRLDSDVDGIVSTRLDMYSIEVALSAIYAYKRIASRFRVFHYCSHLSKGLYREMEEKEEKIPCTIFFENADITVTYDVSSLFRIYGGAGLVLHGRLLEGHVNTNYGNGFIGFDKRFGWKFLPSTDLFRALFCAVDLDFWPWLNYSPSVTLTTGIRFARAPDVGFQYMLNFRYRNGYGFANFKNERINLFELGIEGAF